jgi:hypothetical protein
MKINKKLIFYISITIYHIIFITVAISSAYTINTYIKNVQNEQVKRIEVIHKQLLKTGDINDIRNHANNIWRLHKARRLERLSELKFTESTLDIILILMLGETLCVLMYFIKNERSQQNRIM